MADLFVKQAKQYWDARPTYPPELFDFIASTTSFHDLAWDVGTGSGQAIPPLAERYKKVMGTDTSKKQLELAPKLPNVTYCHTSPVLSVDEIERHVAAHSTVDLVTIAQALHWFDLSTFHEHVKWVLKKPGGVIAAWCYTTPEVNQQVDAVFNRFYTIDSAPYWDDARRLVDDKYRTIEFPFASVKGLDHTGPFEFKVEKLMGLDDYFTYIRSWSAYNTATEKGVELLSEEVIEKFTCAWNADGNNTKVVKFPIYLRIGKVESSS